MTSFSKEKGSVSLYKVLIEQYLSLRRNLSAVHFMRVGKSGLLNAKEGVFQVTVWFQEKSDVAPDRYTEENFFASSSCRYQ